MLLTFSKERDLQSDDKAAMALLGKKEKSGPEFKKPYAAVFHQGKLYVTDTSLHSVVIIDMARKKFEKLKGDHSMGKLKIPVNLAFDSHGDMYVTDTGRKQILVYDSQGRHVRTIGDGNSYTPSGIAIRGDRIYITDVKGHRVLVVDRRTGKEISRFGKPGRKPGEFSFPTNVTVDIDGMIYVSDALGGRVQKFSPQGEHLKTFGRLGKRIGELVRPKGVAVDRRRRLYVADAATQHIQIFDKHGRLLLFFGGNRGTRDSLYLPAGLAIAYDPEAIALLRPIVAKNYTIEYLLVAVSQYGKWRISVFGFLM